MLGFGMGKEYREFIRNDDLSDDLRGMAIPTAQRDSRPFAVRWHPRVHRECGCSTRWPSSWASGPTASQRVPEIAPQHCARRDRARLYRPGLWRHRAALHAVSDIRGARAGVHGQALGSHGGLAIPGSSRASRLVRRRRASTAASAAHELQRHHLLSWRAVRTQASRPCRFGRRRSSAELPCEVAPARPQERAQTAKARAR